MITALAILSVLLLILGARKRLIFCLVVLAVAWPVVLTHLHR